MELKLTEPIVGMVCVAIVISVIVVCITIASAWPEVCVPAPVKPPVESIK